MRQTLTQPGPAAAQRTQQAPLQAPPLVPRCPRPDSTSHCSSVEPRFLAQTASSVPAEAQTRLGRAMQRSSLTPTQPFLTLPDHAVRK